MEQSTIRRLPGSPEVTGTCAYKQPKSDTETTGTTASIWGSGGSGFCPVGSGGGGGSCPGGGSFSATA
ncbi:MAG: hypothetical protein V2B14_06635 [bacterium]